MLKAAMLLALGFWVGVFAGAPSENAGVVGILASLAGVLLTLVVVGAVVWAGLAAVL